MDIELIITEKEINRGIPENKKGTPTPIKSTIWSWLGKTGPSKMV